jgi:hypothetical protein
VVPPLAALTVLVFGVLAIGRRRARKRKATESVEQCRAADSCRARRLIPGVDLHGVSAIDTVDGREEFRR